ncbi:hypothetical protein MKL26_02770 [Streptococcus suis]|nr:hypothetical protein [Streptococcus suis]
MLPLNTFFRSLFLLGILPSIILIYGLVPQRARRWILLLSSYTVFGAFSGKLLFYLLFSTLSIHQFGLWLENSQNKEKALLYNASKEDKRPIKEQIKREQYGIVLFAVMIHIGLLFILKYSAFMTVNINTLLSMFGFNFSFPIPRYLMPVGISFYTLQAVSYIVDVYRKKISADANLLRLAIFMSFFPQILEGPICRYSETANALWEAPKLKYENFLLGVQRIVFGIFKKLVIADRLNLFIQNIFNDYSKYDGFTISVGVALYTLQLYAEFSGTLDLVIGSGQIFGITLPENFKRPFFSSSISEFWQRWHITLGTWFKDYIFYPLSMSGIFKRLTAKLRRKFGNHFGPLMVGSISLLCVWLSNGLWHGAAWHYIFFGMYHFTLILLGNIFAPYFIKLAAFGCIDRTSKVYRYFQIIRTTVLVCIGELFFRSNGLKAGLIMLKKMFMDFNFDSIKNGTLFKIGMDFHDFIIIFISVGILFLIGFLQEHGIAIRSNIMKRNIVIRFTIYYTVIIFIIIFGAYGINYVPVNPIYANF